LSGGNLAGERAHLALGKLSSLLSLAFEELPPEFFQDVDSFHFDLLLFPFLP